MSVEQLGTSQRRYYDCGVPKDACSGFEPITGGKYKGKGYRCHGTLDAAKKCSRDYARQRGIEPPKAQRIMTGKGGRANVPAIRG